MGWVEFWIFAVLGLILLNLGHTDQVEQIVRPEYYEKIRLGMMFNDVQTLIGIPPGDYRQILSFGGTRSTGNWGSTVHEAGLPQEAQAKAVRGVIELNGKRVEIKTWWGTYHAIRIAVDSESRVIGKYSIKIPRNHR